VIFIDLRPEWTRLIGDDAIVNSNGVGFGPAETGNTPGRLVELFDYELATILIVGSERKNIFRKIADLIQRIPDRQLKLRFGPARLRNDGDIDDLTRCFLERDLVLNLRGLRCGNNRRKNNQK